MCNLYSLTKNVDAIRRLFVVEPFNDRTGNLPPLPGIFPDYPALQNFEDLENASSSKAMLWLLIGEDLMLSLSGPGCACRPSWRLDE